MNDNGPLRRALELEKLREVITKCELCHLSQGRIKAVPGEGPITSPIMFIGEAPGRNEDLQGLPFIGRAGTLLNELLQSIRLRREDVFVCNMVKCRPKMVEGKYERDRRPSVEEISTCSIYINRQIELINPRVICTLGDTATSYILNRYGIGHSTIGKIHGQVFTVGKLHIVPLYHPAAALYTAQLKEVMVQDFARVKEVLEHSNLIRSKETFKRP